jgi:hypothetical protein
VTNFMNTESTISRWGKNAMILAGALLAMLGGIACGSGDEGPTMADAASDSQALVAACKEQALKMVANDDDPVAMLDYFRERSDEAARIMTKNVGSVPGMEGYSPDGMKTVCRLGIAQAVASLG